MRRQVSDDVAAYLEFHIEQGVLLESEDKSLGVVQAIAGQSRAEITFTGRARHAGTTPMRLRNDAVAGAAEWISEVERVALATPGMVATVGDLRTHPGAGNVVAGQLRASLDVRHGEDAVRHQAVDHLLAEAVSIAKRRGLTTVSKMLMDQPAVTMDARLCALATGRDPRHRDRTGLHGERGRPRCHDFGGAGSQHDDLSTQPRRHQPSSRRVSSS